MLNCEFAMNEDVASLSSSYVIHNYANSTIFERVILF